MNKNVLSIEQLETKTLLSVVPNDPSVNTQWGLNSISAYNAWHHTIGSRNVVVAVLDSGIDLNHEDLKNNIWTNPGEIPNDGIDNEGDGFVDDVHGWNFANNNNDVQDRYGHGTHVAGIIGAEGNNYVGVAGVNWNVSIMPLKFLDDKGIGDTGGALRAMQYVLMMKNTYHVNIVAINNSWGGGTGFSLLTAAAMQQLGNAGIIAVCAAGNSGSDNDITPRYPSSYTMNNIIAVAGLSSDNANLAAWSNYGKNSVDIAAPGGGVMSTLPYDNRYGYLSGTSMAAPFVTGAVALLNSIKPLTVAEATAAIFGSADQLASLLDKVSTGGKLNVDAAVHRVLGQEYDHNQAPVGAITAQTFSSISGWARDNDSIGIGINVQLWVDNNLVTSQLTNSDGSFVFNLGGLKVGSHVINVKAQDAQTGSWSTIGSTTVTIKPPVVHVGFLSISRITGWAFSERNGKSPVVVRILVNDRLVAAQWANQYRPALTYTVGSAYHGFNILLNRNWFHRGYNNVKIQVFDPVSKEITITNQFTIRK